MYIGICVYFIPRYLTLLFMITDSIIHLGLLFAFVAPVIKYAMERERTEYKALSLTNLLVSSIVIAVTTATLCTFVFHAASPNDVAENGILPHLNTFVCVLASCYLTRGGWSFMNKQDRGQIYVTRKSMMSQVPKINVV